MKRILQWGLSLLCIAAACLASAQSLREIASVSHDIASITASENAQGQVEITFQSQVSSEQYQGEARLVLSVLDSRGSLVDQIAGPEISVAKQSVTKQVLFTLPFVPRATDAVVVAAVDPQGVPLDVDRIAVDWAGLTKDQYTENTVVLSDCNYTENSVRCLASETLAEGLVLGLYTEAVGGSPVTTATVQTQQGMDEVVFDGVAIPETNGLYVYEVRNQEGVHVFTGSQRVGPLPKYADTGETLSAESATSTSWTTNDLLVPGGVFVFSFLLALGMAVWGRSWFRYMGIVITALLLLLISYVVVLAAVYVSDDYPQFRYTVSVEAQDDDVYWLTYAALDTYSGLAPTVQNIDITLDGVDYQNIFNNTSGSAVMTAEINIPDEQASTTALVIRDGCASYYGSSSLSRYAASLYGTRDCAPVLLFPSDDAVFGCMNPAAVNYNDRATINTGVCDFRGCTNPSAINYDASATINDGSCELYGCMDPEHPQYDPRATVNDVSVCPRVGCTNPDSPNYNPQATINDGSCGNCSWIPVYDDMRNYCTFESFSQQNTCTNEYRTITGTKPNQWIPNINADDICLGYAITQIQECSATNPAPSRILQGTGTGSFCIVPEVTFQVSTNQTNWSSCSALGRVQLARPDQPLYVKSVGTDEIASWNVSQAAGQITGSARLLGDDVWALDLDYLVNQKFYNNVNIVGRSQTGAQTSQICNLSLLQFTITEE